MKKIFMVLSCFLAVFALFILFNIQHVDKNNGSAIDISQEEYHSKLSYIVKSYNGNIAIFENNNNDPFKITNTRLKDLPDEDKKLLNNGIRVSDYNELNCILEDYCS